MNKTVTFVQVAAHEPTRVLGTDAAGFSGMWVVDPRAFPEAAAEGL